MTAKTIISIAAVIVLTACSASEDQELREFLSRHDSHWTEIRCDIDTPGPDRPSGWKGGNKEGYYSGALMGNGLLGTNMYKATHAASRPICSLMSSSSAATENLSVSKCSLVRNWKTPGRSSNSTPLPERPHQSQDKGHQEFIAIP